MEREITPDKLARFDALLRQKGIAVADPGGIPCRPAGSRIPLTPAQSRIWSLHQLAPDKPAYNMRLATKIDGPVNPTHLSEAINQVVVRHESLRTYFANRGPNRPEQVVVAELTLDVGIKEAADYDAAVRAAAELVRRPFDLSQLPLLRAGIWQWTETKNETLLVLVSHQILFDGNSLGRLLHDVKKAYVALRAGRQPALDPLPIQFGDYAVWQADRRGGQEADENADLAYWQRRLARPYRPLSLPYDAPRPAVETHAGALHPFDISADVTTGLRQLCRETGTTLFAALNAALTVLLYSYGATEEVLSFTTTEGRRWPEVTKLIGLFARQLPLRRPVTATVTPRQLLTQTQTVIQEATAHDSVDFETLVDLIQLTPGHPPAALFQVMLLLLGQKVDAASTTGAVEPAWTPVHIGNQMAKFDWRFIVHDGETQLSGYLEYKTELFDAATIDRTLARLQAILADIVHQPDVPLADLPSVAAAQPAAPILATVGTGPAVVDKEAYKAPRNRLEWQLTQMWEDLFARHPIGSKDNFFALGGHSLLAVQFFTRLEQELGHQLPLRLLAERPTIAGLAAAITAGGWQPRWQTLVPLQPRGERPPLFAVPPAGRSVASFSLLAHHLHADQPLFAFQPHGLEAGERPLDDVPAMAAAYLDDLRRAQPAGPFYLMGRCFGGLVALEMARQLHQAGETVAFLAIVDTILSPRRGRPPAQRDASFYGRRLSQRLRRDPRRLLHRLWNSLVAEPWRNVRKSYNAARDSFVWADGDIRALGDNLRTWRRMMRILQAHNRAGQRYFLHQPYPGTIHFFASADTPPLRSQFHWRWPDLAGAEFVQHTVPGNHVSMANADNVAVMADLLNNALSTAATGKEMPA